MVEDRGAWRAAVTEQQQSTTSFEEKGTIFLLYGFMFMYITVWPRKNSYV